MAENFILFVLLLLPFILFSLTANFIREVNTAKPRANFKLKFATSFFIFLFLTSLPLLGGEIYYRFFYDQTDSFGLCKTTKRWFDRHFQRNKTGFRDSYNYLPTVSESKRRVTFLGDSFTVGHGIEDVEDRFANLIRNSQDRYEVHVLAECGWDTGKHLELIEFLPKSGYETDICVLVYCLNDISDITPEWKEIVERLYDKENRFFLTEHSYLFSMLSARIQMAREPVIHDYYNFLKGAYDGEIWNQQQDRLREFNKSVKNNGAKLMVVTFPFLHSKEARSDYQEVHQKINEFWKSENVPHLDLSDVYRDSSPSEVVVNPNDAHPNEYAHQLAANAILTFLDNAIEEKAFSRGTDSFDQSNETLDSPKAEESPLSDE